MAKNSWDQNRAVPAQPVSVKPAPEHPPAANLLPEPTLFLEKLTRGALEVLAGVRDAEQLARWLTEEAFTVLSYRANWARRERSVRGERALRPVFKIISVRHSSPAPGRIEGNLVVASPTRTRAVAIRLELMPARTTSGQRWRASSLVIL